MLVRPKAVASSEIYMPSKALGENRGCCRIHTHSLRHPIVAEIEQYKISTRRVILSAAWQLDVRMYFDCVSALRAMFFLQIAQTKKTDDDDSYWQRYCYRRPYFNRGLVHKYIYAI